jgi:UDPglucose 6-dehydrogenase
MDERVAVIGLGRLGFPLAIALAHRGFKVIGIDIDPDVVEAVNAHRIPEHICEPGLQEMLDGTENLIGTTDMEAAAFASISIILVGTPADSDGAFSLALVLTVCQALGIQLRSRDAYHTVIISSTVLTGSCDGPIREALEETSGRKVGENLGLCYCPEFVALGDTLRGFLEPDFVVIGSSDIKADFQARRLYERFCQNDPPIIRANLVNAEIAKLAVNGYISTKMTFANMLAELCERIPGANVDAVTGIVGLDSRIGRKYLTGATAYGGSTFPMAMRSLLKIAESVDIELPLIEAVDSTNQRQVHRLAEMVQNWRIRTEAEKIGILGLAYKSGISATDGSVGMALMKLLRPHESVIAFDPMRQIKQSVASAQTCTDYSDIVVITTPWPEFGEVKFHKGQIVIDCWRMLDEEDVISAGAQYIAIGVGPCRES